PKQLFGLVRQTEHGASRFSTGSWHQVRILAAMLKPTLIRIRLTYKDGMILIMRHFRHATRSWHWEIPRGFGEAGVSAEENARNEVEEEVGGVVAELISLGILHNNAGLEGHEEKLFLARLLSIGQPGQNEGIQSFRWVSVLELEGMIASGEITDGFTIAAYARAKLNGFFITEERKRTD
ncbi:MAG: NUDIX domain-containing protein, partial [Nitrososphaera sp.]|nr:NUDIX domain-containing protein [Nitrososphaera sp.]